MTATIEQDTAPIVGASPARAMSRFFRHAFTLRGRASRSEYWWWVLVNVAMLSVCQFLMPFLISGKTPNPTLLLGPFGSLFYADIPLFTISPTAAPSHPLAAFFLIVAAAWIVLTLVPGVTVMVRRLHDSDLSGWWALIVVLPLGSFILLLLATRRSRPEGVRFDV
jgi:uncharacterized membrane protein YhaH (DUF805 family)